MSEFNESTSVLGLRLIIVGFLLSVIGFALVAIGAASQIPGPPSPSAGIVIFIGPIPIVIGSGPQGPILVIAGLIIAALMILLTALLLRSRPTLPRTEPPEGSERADG
mgnify:FL=1